MICSHPEFFSFSDPLSILSLSPSLPPSLFLLLFHLLFLSLHLLSSSSIYTSFSVSSFSVTYFSTAVCSLFAWLLFLPPHWFHLFSILYPPCPTILPHYVLSVRKFHVSLSVLCIFCVTRERVTFKAGGPYKL